MKSVLHVVCLLTPDNKFGGPTSVAADICTELRQRGLDVTIAGMFDGWTKRPASYNGIPVIVGRARRMLGQPGFPWMFSASAFFRTLRASREHEIVHVHMGRDLFTCLTTLFLALMRRPLVLQTHGMMPPKLGWLHKAYDALLVAPVMRRARQVLYLTDRESRDLRSQFPAVGKNLTRLTNGIAVSPDSQVLPRNRRTSVVFAARLQERKRPISFVRAATLLLSTGDVDHSDEITFEIIGPDEGELDAILSAIPVAFKERIKYLGSYTRDALRQRLGESVAFVLPSVNEPYPVTILESLATGTPVICTDSCGLAEDIDGAGAGLVVRPSDVDLSKAMASLISDHPGWENYSRNALLLARRAFDIRVVADRLLAVYQQPSAT